ncbi:hypothetical protein [Pseudooceanicola sp.]|uniref:hypothetical protein n=1 Tax=Pseudooceanicola sp. TaxID=1914328 RepID=UPI0026058ED9|nr:hypothetical protein [Pseudooceanicola sp.]MDF1855518.1 hypothetical protein [Pseudooceanicola sp.]
MIEWLSFDLVQAVLAALGLGVTVSEVFKKKSEVYEVAIGSLRRYFCFGFRGLRFDYKVGSGSRSIGIAQ